MSAAAVAVPQVQQQQQQQQIQEQSAQEQVNQSSQETGFSVACLVEARKEYETRLTQDVARALYASMKALFIDAQKYVKKKMEDGESEFEGDPDDEAQEVFIQLLAEVALWNSDVIADEAKSIDEAYAHARKLLKRVIQYNAQILGSLSKRNSFEIRMPSFESFVHLAWKTVAEAFSDKYAFVDRQGKLDRNAHIREMRQCVHDSLKQLIPIGDFVEDDSADVPAQVVEDVPLPATNPPPVPTPHPQQQQQHQQHQQLQQQSNTPDGEDEELAESIQAMQDERDRLTRPQTDDDGNTRRVKVSHAALYPEDQERDEMNGDLEDEYESDDDF